VTQTVSAATRETLQLTAALLPPRAAQDSPPTYKAARALAAEAEEAAEAEAAAQ
jgi:hypothetical protein